jgi:HEAT repeat protein
VLGSILGGERALADWLPFGGRSAAGAEVAALRGQDRGARARAARALGRIGERDAVVPALIEVLEHEPDETTRIAIVDALARRRDRAAIEPLIANVPAMGVAEREARCRALAAIDDPAARRALASMLGGPGAAIALPFVVEIGAPIVEDLIALLEVPVTLERAAEALGEIGDGRGIDALAARAAADEPAHRAAILRGLGAAGDERAQPLAIAAIDTAGGEDRARAVVTVAALEALARIGTLEASPAIAARVEDEDPAIAAAALRALAIVDPARAVPALERASTEAAPSALRAVARAIVIASPDVAFAPMLAARADDPALDALARIDGGAGIPTLLGIPAHARARVPIALALRRAPELGGALRAEALARLREDDDPDRRAVLLAIARERESEETFVAELASGGPAERAIAARALRTLGGPPSGRALAALTSAIATERDPVALEAIAGALGELGGTIDPGLVIDLDEPALLPARLAMTAIARRPANAELRRELRLLPREALRDPSPRVRALAIAVLAREREPSVIAIAARLEDPAPAVRLAAARALGSIPGAPDLASDRIASRAAIESDPWARRALLDALAPAAASRPRGGVQGDLCLAIALDRGGAPTIGAIEIVLADGRWLRERPLATGELVVCDLPRGDADLLLPP